MIRARVLSSARQAFAGDRRLVDAGAAAGHLAVECDAFAGLHAHGGFQFHLLGRQFLPFAADQHGGLFRSQLQQAADGVARAIQGLRLDQLGDGEQHADHRRFRPLADEHGAGHGDTHQGVDVQVTVLQCDPALAVGRQAGAEDGQQGEAGDHPVRRQAEPFDDLRGQRHRAGQGQRPPGLRRRLRGAVGIFAGIQRHRLHAEAGDQLLQRLDAVEAMLDAQQALHQVEFQRLHCRLATEGVADQAFLGRAVHRFDAQVAPAQLGVAGQGSDGGHRRARRVAVPMIMSVTVTVTVTASVGVFVAHGNNSRLTCWVRLHTL